ncbi:TPA: hypothetical protein ACH3X2_007273, partial [Trebouxia sp. C0005]
MTASFPLHHVELDMVACRVEVRRIELFISAAYSAGRRWSADLFEGASADARWGATGFSHNATNSEAEGFRALDTHSSAFRIQTRTFVQ